MCVCCVVYVVVIREQCSLSLLIIYMIFFFYVVGRELKDEKYKYVDVRPTAPNVTIHGLKSNTPYLFSVMAANEAGGSKYLPDIKKTMAKGEFLLVSTFLYYSNLFAFRWRPLG